MLIIAHIFRDGVNTKSIENFRINTNIKSPNTEPEYPLRVSLPKSIKLIIYTLDSPKILYTQNSRDTKIG